MNYMEDTCTCNKINCENYKYYSNWNNYLGTVTRKLSICQGCKWAYKSKYKRDLTRCENEKRII